MKTHNHIHQAKEKILSEMEHITNYIKNHAKNDANRSHDKKFSEFLDKAQSTLEQLITELSKYTLT